MIKYSFAFISVVALLAPLGCDQQVPSETDATSSEGIYQPKFQHDPAKELEGFLAGETGYDCQPAVMFDDDRREIQTPTVKDVIDAWDRGYKPACDGEFRTVLHFRATADRLRRLIAAKPSRQSHVRDFQCTPEFINELPDTVWNVLAYNVPDNSDNDGPPRVVPSGKRFVDVRQPDEVTVSSDADAGEYQTIFIKYPKQSSELWFDHEGCVILSFHGWGDFDGDGLEDLFFSVREWNHMATGGRTYPVGDLILTKRQAEGPWHVVTRGE